PISVVTSTIKAACTLAAGQVAASGAISAHVAALTEGVLKGMLLAKLRIPLTVVVALALAGTGVAHRVLQTQAAGAARTVQPSPMQDSPALGGQAGPGEKAATKPAAVRGQEFLNDALKEFEAAKDEPGDERHRLLSEMAGLQARLGDRNAARKLF